ncbi:MAG: fibronectin type III domain-containing protein, partial [Egibacteraceae bacterium]
MRNRARWSAVLTAMLVAALVPAAGAGAHGDGDGVEAYHSEEHTVTVIEEEFIPEVITVSAGDTVTWQAPSDNLEEHTLHEDDSLLFEESLFPGTSFSYRFTRTGTYTYHCDIHPGMDGAVVVESLEEPVAPEAPRDVEATAGPESATVAWSSPEFDGGSAVTDYVVTTLPGGQRDIFGDSPATITGLTPGESYTFEVRAINEVGESDPATSNAVTPTEDTDPDPTPTPGAGPCPEDVAPAPFTDRDAIPSTHRGNVDCASSLAVVTGFSDDTYRPTLSVRRDQMASFIARSLDAA